MATPVPDPDVTRETGETETPVTTTAEASTAQDSVDLGGTTAVTNNRVDFSDLFGRTSADANQEEPDTATSESDSDYESDLEEIEPPRPVKKGGRHVLPSAPPRSVGGASHRRYRNEIDKLMNSRASVSDDEEDEFIPDGSYADYRYDGPTKGSTTKKTWVRQDAIQFLNVEFWLTRPEHKAGEEPDFDCPRAEANHTDYEIYLRLERMIHEYYTSNEDGDPDEGAADADTPMTHPTEKGKEPAGSKRDKTKGESNVIRKTKNRVRDAVKAYLHGGYGYSRGSKKWYTEFLPDRAELMLPRYVDPYGATNATIAGHLQTMKRSWMAEIGGRPDTGTSDKQVGINDNMSAIAANAAATSIATANEVNDIKANMVKLRDQMVAKVRQMDGTQKELVDKVDTLEEETGRYNEELNSQAVRISLCEGMKKSINEFNETLKGLDTAVAKMVAAEVKKQLAAKQLAAPIRKPKPTPVMEDPTDKRATPAAPNPAARNTTGARGGIAKASSFGQSPAKPAKKRTSGTAKSSNAHDKRKNDGLGWDQNLFDME
ncbi:hypothetical protein NCS56_01433500 [Fusarium sp. Ph1]|nr:hypothetical protein NCS56_01433500 [Fusarium sp. Ph1]